MSETNEPQEIITLEQQHERGYRNQPQTADETNEWEPEQFWDKYEPEKTQ
jgi:hypothetical protein